MKNLFTFLLVLLTLLGKSQTNFGTLVSFPDTSKTAQNMIDIANQLNVQYIRQSVVMQGWDGTSTRFDQFTAGGLKVLLNVNWGNPAVAPIPFPTDTVAYKQQLSAILDIHHPEVVVIENEELTLDYHSGPISDYINELTAAIGVCHSKGLKVTNAGLLTTPLCILIYNDFISRGLTAHAADFKDRTFNQNMLSYIANPASDPGLDARVANCYACISAYTNLNLDYVNFHLAEPVNASGFTDGTGATPGVYQDIMDYLTRVTGKPVLTNETAQKNLTPSLATSMLDAYQRTGIKYAIWYSGDGGIDFADSALHNSDGTLRLSGIAFSNFMSNKTQDLTQPGLFTSTITKFDTVCVNSTSTSRFFTLIGSYLNGSNVTVGPLPGYIFSSSDTGSFSPTLTLSNYGNAFTKGIYVRFNPTQPGLYNVNIPITGGGVTLANAAVNGIAVNTSPALSGTVTNISCYNAKNGAINLVATGGSGSFNYSWTLAGKVKYTTEDISQLVPGDYTVTVSSPGGCSVSKNYSVTQPNTLVASVSADDMVCSNGTVSLNVTAIGGTLPYSGTGTFNVSYGSNPYLVTDANGCTDIMYYSVTNGTLLHPPKPSAIIANGDDPNSLCNGGSFTYSIAPVATATSYTWISPAGTTLATTNSDGTQVSLNVPAGYLNDSISVTANNICGSSTAVIRSLISVPAKPLGIVGVAQVSSLKTGLVYYLVSTPGVTYTWTVPEGAVIISGQNTSSITVNWGTSSGDITVKAVNSCGSSPAAVLTVTTFAGQLSTSIPSLSAFETVCVNGISNAQSFTLTGAGVNGTDLIIGPLAGFKFSSSANGAPVDTLTLSYAGSTPTKTIYVKFSPLAVGNYSGNIPLSGGGGLPISIGVSGTAVNSSPVLSVNTNNISCAGAKNGVLDLTPIGGTGPFTYVWTGTGTPLTTQDLNGLSPGNYTVTVSSYAGCSASGTYAVTQPDNLGINFSADSMVCKNSTTNVYVNGTGGTMPYTGTGTFALSTGTYSYTVTDANGCVQTKSIFVPNGTGLPPAKPTIINGPAADATGLCGGGNFAYSIDPVSTATSYTWSPPSGSSVQSSTGGGTQISLNVLPGFTTGILSVTANNVCGVSTAAGKSLTALPAAPGVITGPTSVTATQTGLTYSITPIAGVTYTWTVPAAAQILSGQNTSSITVKWGSANANVKVSASNACGVSALSTLGVTVVTTTVMNASVSSIPAFDPLCVNGSSIKSFNLYGVLLNGSNVTVGAVSGYKYSTSSNGTYSNTLTLSGYGTTLSQVIYVKFNPSASGTFSGNIPVSGGGATALNVAVSGTAVNSSPSLSFTVTNVACNGSQSGSINLTTSGGTGPFTYSWTNGGSSVSSSEDISGISAGTYSVTVTALGGCTAALSATVNQPAALSSSTSAGTISCNGGTSNVTVTASGGVLPYSGTGTFPVTAGTNNYTVTDANGCSTTKSVTINQPAVLIVSALTDPILCHGGTTDITISASGGTAPYSGEGIFRVNAGNFSFTVTDANGCSVTKADITTQPSKLIASASVGNIGNSGTAPVTISATGGIAPYTGTGIFNVIPGTHQYTVTDNNGCSAATSITVNGPTGLSVNALPGSILCKAGTTTISVNATGGAAPYSGTGQFTVGAGTYNYTVTDALGNTASTSVTVSEPEVLNSSVSAGTILCNGNTTNVTVNASGGTAPYNGTGIFAVAAGSYSYLITDANGCTISKSITIGQPSPLSASATAGAVSVNGTATVTVTATGGTIPYTGTGTFTQGPGTYTYAITDNNGCSASTTATIAELSPLIASTSVGTILCNGGTTTVTVSATGGAAPYNGTGSFSAGAGIHQYIVTDAHGNSTTATITVTEPTMLTVSANASTILCNGGSTILTVSASGGTNPYTGTGNFTLGAGSYNYTVKDANNCTIVKSVNITQPPVLSGSAVAGTILCNGGNTTVAVNAAGGVSPYTGAGNFSVPAGTYSFNINDANGCAITKSVTITQPSSLVVTASTGTIVCNGGTGSVSISAAGGVTPYNGTGNFTVNAGTYNYTITDANGCSSNKSVTLANGTQQIPAKPSVITGADADMIGLCGGGVFAYSIDSVSSATSYSWIPPAGSTVSVINAAGTQIQLTVPAGFVTDSISVKANNVCGSSPASVKSLSAKPAQPSAITGALSVLPLKTGLTYSVPYKAGLTTTWTVPSGAMIVSGQNTSSIVVTWGTISGNVTAKSVNSCGSSSATSLVVSVLNGVFTPSVSSLPAFDTVCLNGLSAYKSFTLNGSGLNNTNITAGPAAGFKFSTTATGTYSDSLVIAGGYGTTISQAVFVKFSPSSTGSYSTGINISGGGAAPASVAAIGTSVNSSPALAALITNISCSGAKNGSIDLSLTGGTGPFTYTWVGTGTFNHALQDISGLSPVNYSVTVGSYAGCTTNANYTVTEPALMIAGLSADPMICKNGTTNVYVTATGGTPLYTGTGTFVKGPGVSSFTVTDAKGCVSTKSITVANGTGVAPAKPVVINGPAADASGLCGGGSFVFSIDTVATATSYTWTKPADSSITINTAGTQATLGIPTNFVKDSVSVKANNVCGSSAATVKQLTNLPGKPASVSGPVSVAPSQSGIVYSVPATAGLTYTWAVPGAALITAGQNTSSITVTWGVTAGSVTVKAVNNCGSSANATLAVSTVNAMFVATPSSLIFDTLCVNGLGVSQSFKLSASGLSGANVVIGPLTGYVFSLTNAGTYTSSVAITGYGTSINQSVFVKFNPLTVGAFNGNIPVSGGGAAAASVAVTGRSVNSSPALTAAITNVTCNGLKNGAVDVTLTGGTAPFTYTWTGTGTFDHAAQDISAVAAASYTISVGSYAGCTTSATYTVNQPNVLTASLAADNMVCKNGTTNVYVSATGGTLAYTGTGTFVKSSGANSFTVTDVNGCSSVKSITIANGTGVAPAKPVTINGAAADATGVCGGGNFAYAIDSVATATSYTWTAPAGSSIASTSNGGKQAVLAAPAGFTTGTLSVTANNVCGSSAATTKALSNIPGKPGSITGPVSVTAQQTGLVYSVTPAAGLTYTWTVPGTGSILSGQNTSSITAKWGAASGNVIVKAVNSCGTSVSTTLAVTVTVAIAAQQSSEGISTATEGRPGIMPNPAKDVAYFTFNAADNYKYTVIITDLAGKILQRNEALAAKGSNRVKLDVHNYTNGLYIVTLVKANGERSTLKLVKE